MCIIFMCYVSVVYSIIIVLVKIIPQQKHLLCYLQDRLQWLLLIVPLAIAAFERKLYNVLQI